MVMKDSVGEDYTELDSSQKEILAKRVVQLAYLSDHAKGSGEYIYFVHEMFELAMYLIPHWFRGNWDASKVRRFFKECLGFIADPLADSPERFSVMLVKANRIKARILVGLVAEGLIKDFKGVPVYVKSSKKLNSKEGKAHEAVYESADSEGLYE